MLNLKGNRISGVYVERMAVDGFPLTAPFQRLLDALSEQNQLIGKPPAPLPPPLPVALCSGYYLIYCIYDGDEYTYTTSALAIHVLFTFLLLPSLSHYTLSSLSYQHISLTRSMHLVLDVSGNLLGGLSQLKFSPNFKNSDGVALFPECLEYGQRNLDAIITFLTKCTR